MKARGEREPGEPSVRGVRGPEESLLSAAFLERMLAEFARDPEAVPKGWRDYFAANGDGDGDGGHGGRPAAPRLAPSFAPAQPGG